MTSSIHYKFRTQNVYKTLSFDGTSISIPELKRSICAAEGIKAELFDLTFSNSFSSKPYGGDDLIPRNSSVTVQRVPVENGGKLPKISNPEIASNAQSMQAAPDSAAHIKAEDFQKMTEAERLKHAMHQSTYKYAPTNYNRKPTNNMQAAPPDYQCNRCNQYGHFPKACPLINIRRTTGIPNEELVETTPDDPNAMLHPSGRFVIHKMHVQAREQQKIRDEQKRLGKIPKPKRPEEEEVPEDLKCPMCNNLYKEALTTRCGESFCADCIQDKLIAASLADEIYLCPICNKPITTNDLVPNNSLRESVSKHNKQILAQYTNVMLDPGRPLTPEVVVKSPSPQQIKAENLGDAPTPPVDSEPTLPNIEKQEEPIRLPTVNLSAILAPANNGIRISPEPGPSAAPLVNAADPIVNYSMPPPMAVPPVVADFTKPPPIALMNFSVPPPTTSVPMIPQPAPKPKPKEPEKIEFDERDKEVISSAWDNIATLDESMDLSDLLFGRRHSPTPEPKHEKEVKRRSRTRTLSRSRSPSSAKSYSSEEEDKTSKDRYRSRSPDRRSRSKDVRARSRSSERKSRSKERVPRSSGHDRRRNRSRSRSPLIHKSESSKYDRKEQRSSHHRNDDSSRRPKNDSNRRHDARPSERPNVEKEERSERRIIDLPVQKKESQSKKSKAPESESQNKNGPIISGSISGGARKANAKADDVTDSEEEVRLLKKPSRRRSSSRSVDHKKASSAKEEKKKSKSEEKKKKKRRHDSDSDDDDEDKKKKKRKKKEKKHKKDRKREKYDSESDSERVSRKRRK
uniref:E3 ubiquitin-protein ligase RBBP6 n=1 Tax=Panagrellus redivivus TaxID=6233 RepID=A0A7E4UUN0_PANRE